MKKIIVAVSGGPDSMALLDMLYTEKKYDIIVAHVNYQKRKTANRDEKIVQAYCDRNSLLFRVLRPVFFHDDNFQAWARKVRYDFFMELGKEYHIEDVYVAHHKDDLIETYIFQKNRDMLCEWYGIKPESVYKSIHIHRPLLSYTKAELKRYCDEKDIEYGIDESNLSDAYTRNKIRHKVVDFMSLKEKDQIVSEIEIENDALQKLRIEMDDFFKTWDQDLSILSKSWMYLEFYLYTKTGKHFARKYCVSLMEQLKQNALIDLKGFYLERFGNAIYLEEKKEEVDLCFDAITYGDYPSFKLCKEGKVIEGITLSKADFPIRVRTVRAGDTILLRLGRKNIHRFFVDRKIPKHKRLDWIVVENRQKDIIFVPGIGCDINHFSVKPNLFVLK